VVTGLSRSEVARGLAADVRERGHGGRKEEKGSGGWSSCRDAGASGDAGWSEPGERAAEVEGKADGWGLPVSCPG
jgi:hypothetical protein